MQSHDANEVLEYKIRLLEIALVEYCVKYGISDMARTAFQSHDIRALKAEIEWYTERKGRIN